MTTDQTVKAEDDAAMELMRAMRIEVERIKKFNRENPGKEIDTREHMHYFMMHFRPSDRGKS